MTQHSKGESNLQQTLSVDGVQTFTEQSHMTWDDGLARATLGEHQNENINANSTGWKRTTVVKEKVMDDSKP